jgi:hypothetical protein
MTAIFLYEIEHYNPVANAVETLRVSDIGYIEPTLGLKYPKRIKKGGSARFETFAYSRNETLGRSSVGDGSIELVNIDRQYDRLLQHDFRKVTIRRLDNAAQNISEAFIVATMEVEGVEIGWQSLRLSVVDRMLLFNRQAQFATFAGNNANAYDAQGNEAIAGSIKPVLIGKVGWFEAILVNPQSLLYIINHTKAGAPAAIQSIEGVKDRGVNLTFYSNYSTLNALIAAQQAGSIPAGNYATCLSAGAFALGSFPSGAITCAASEGATAGDRSVVQCVRRLITLFSDVVSTDFENVTAVDAMASGECGVYIDGADTLLEQCSFLLNSGAIFLTPTLGGKFRFGKLRDVSGETSIKTFKANNILQSIERIILGDATGGLPTHKVVVNYKKYYRALSASEAGGSLSVAAKQDLSQTFRGAQAEDASVLVKYKKSEPLVIETALFNQSDAQAFANEVLAFRKQWHDMFIIEVEDKYSYDIGDVVTLQHDAFGLNYGKKYIILGLAINLERGAIAYYLYG